MGLDFQKKILKRGKKKHHHSQIQKYYKRTKTTSTDAKEPNVMIL